MNRDEPVMEAAERGGEQGGHPVENDESDNESMDYESDDDEEDDDSNHDEPSMSLSPDDRRLALQLKQALQQGIHNTNTGDDSTFPMISDYELVQHAYVMRHSRVSIAQTIARIRQLHYFQQEYNIHDNLQDGLTSIQSFLEQQPGCILHLEQHPTATGVGSQGVVLFDMNKWKPQDAMDHPRPSMAGLYYVWQAGFPNFASMREGATCIMEWAGVDYNNDTTTTTTTTSTTASSSSSGDYLYGMTANVQWHCKAHQEWMSSYPSIFKKMLSYNTNTFVNVFVSIVKPFLRKDVRDRIVLGQKWDADGVASSTFLRHYLQMPEGLDVTNRIVMAAAQDQLTERYRHYQQFRL